MRINEKERLILKGVFSIHEYNSNYELESITNSGVDMFIYIDKNTTKNVAKQLEEYVDNCDLDELIDTHRQNEDYKNSFSIKESIEDFECWLDSISDIVKDLYTLDIQSDYEDDCETDYEDDYNDDCESDCEDDCEDDCEEEYHYVQILNCVGVRDTENGFEIALMGYNYNIFGRYNIEMNIKGYTQSELFDICYIISNRIKNLYYANNGVLEKDDILKIVREEIVK